MAQAIDRDETLGRSLQEIVAEGLAEDGGENEAVAEVVLPHIATIIMQRQIVDELAGYHWRTESPIENAMYWSLLLEGYHRADNLIVRTGNRSTGADAREPEVLWIEPQAEMGKYRVDFLLTARERWDREEYADAQIVVECDGHDFHERTKEQARKDKSRDRALQALGVRVLHFTGSEIWRDPIGCAREAIEQSFNEATVRLRAKYR